MRPWPAVRARRQTAAAVPVGRSRRAAGRAAGRREECRGWWTWRENPADWAAVEGGRDILPAAATRGLPSRGRAQTPPRRSGEDTSELQSPCKLLFPLL